MPATQLAEVTEVGSGDERRPLMTSANMAWMNLGFFGVQFSFGLTQSAVNPIFLFLGAEAHSLPILNIAGPITGLLIQPFIGAMSDKTWSPRWGRRKPFILGGSLVMIAILFLFPLVTALWMAVICLWLVDAGNNTAMEPYRALISDRLRKTQIPKGFLIQSMFTGAGAVLANVSLFVFQKIFPGGAEGAVPTWVFVVFWFGAVCAIVTVGLAMLRTKEISPTDDELAHMRSQSKGIPATVREVAEAVRVMPIGMHKIGLAFLFQWYAMFIYWQFVSVSVAESVWDAAPDTPGYEEAAGWVGLMNGSYNFVTMLSALFLLPLCHRYGGKKVHAGTLTLAGLSLAWLSTIDNQLLTLAPMIGLGICWASMVGVPYLMVAGMVPRERTGVYMGILNMMIVVPMLIQTLTFGWIFENLLASRGTNAILLAGALLGCAALAMLWVNPPRSDEESLVLPLGGQREITVYDRVVVGSDGSPSALYAVARAHEVAAAAQARMVVVAAYDPGDSASQQEQLGGRRLLYGQRAARAAMSASVRELTSERIRDIEQVIVAARPAEALLQVANRNPASLIVVGNRGLGAQEGEVLGSVPREIVQHAACDVLVVQTSALHDDVLVDESRGQSR
ncbi:maltose/moltooligosaccharide transporter [Friedmanniella luteola]|uniref:Maltose/moltooligosaccharide transporter n=1 Tax=Friedmanniella luteola TaxID=546871 RepID=A0A1H1RN64_9ACTN|nr:MFS transporter [Friedmanniella luteola]SDS37135.1 maltose/moltooligosaccharide transporter [Friedmanniella luteola]